MEFVKLVNCCRYLVTNTFFSPVIWPLLSYILLVFLFDCLVCCIGTVDWSTVSFPLAQGHSEDSIILKRCRYDYVFPRAVVIALKLGVGLIFVFSLSLMLGKTGVLHIVTSDVRLRWVVSFTLWRLSRRRKCLGACWIGVWVGLWRGFYFCGATAPLGPRPPPLCWGFYGVIEKDGRDLKPL